MKDLRGVHVSAVKTAIFKEFGLQVISKKNVKVIADWKKSKQVRECYQKLYAENDNTIEKIAKRAFPSISEDDETFENIYIYTAAVCDIVLNPKYPDIECSKNPLRRRYQKFKVFGEFLFLLLFKIKIIKLYRINTLGVDRGQ